MFRMYKPIPLYICFPDHIENSLHEKKKEDQITRQQLLSLYS
jgi:hypothetical protein